ncbi:MAG: PDGLE domain-containing protein [Desulfitobacterium hafniense]|nr:PDGLE domain-containing protein [Desulfitobacterium hafniense]
MKGIYKILILALIVAAFLSPFASSSPDGLEKVAEDLGFIDKSNESPIIKSPFPDYVFPGIKNEGAATAVAGIAGTLITFGVMVGLAKTVGKKTRRTQ